MACLKVVALFVLLGLACGEVKFPAPCGVDDMQCLNSANEDYLKIIAKGLPEYDIKPIDPMDLPNVVVPINDELKLTYTNVKITGFQNEKISDFTLHRDGKYMTFKGREKLSIDGSVTGDFLKLEKSLTGTVKKSVDALIHIRLDYDVRTDDKGVKFMDVGKDSYTCEATEVTYTLDPKLKEDADNDAELSKVAGKYFARMDELNKKIACDLILAAYPTVMDGFRKSAVAMPISAFFTDF